MIAGTIYNTVIDTLKNNSTLSVYIKNVFKGLRTNIEPDGMPCIAVEPASNNDIELDVNQYKRIHLGLDIVAFSYCPVDADKSIVGNREWKGVLDIENDIRACLQSSYDLGGTVIDIKFEPTQFDYQNFPVRSILVPIKIMYQQNQGV